MPCWFRSSEGRHCLIAAEVERRWVPSVPPPLRQLAPVLLRPAVRAALKIPNSNFTTIGFLLPYTYAFLAPFRRFARRPRSVAFQLKQSVCPHCGVAQTLNRHSKLKLHDPDATADNQRVHCGQRVYCSNRNARNGCGRTSVIRLAIRTPRHTLRLDRAWLIFTGMRSGLSIREARLQSGTRLGLSAIYAFVRRFRRFQDRLRTRLLSFKPPPASCSSTDSLLQTLAHLQCAFGDSALSRFQLHFQCPLFS